jgi:molecular chaperone HtpG
MTVLLFDSLLMLRALIRKDNIGAVTRASGFDSLRVRVGNILIGDASLLDSCFREARFNGYLVGEIHVATGDLIPNGRRDDFQDSEMKTDFLLGVEKVVHPLEKKIRDDSSRKNSVKPIEEAKQTIIGINKQLENGFVGDAEKKEAMATLRTADQKLTEVQKKRNIPDAVKEKAEAVSEDVKLLITEVKETDPSIDGALEGTTFSKKEKELIRMVLEAMYELYDKINGRDDLKNRVIQKLKRSSR